jgi:hypothetical protein
MELEGVVQNGVIVPQGECSLPEGSRVRIQPMLPNDRPKSEHARLTDRLHQLAKKYENMPCDLPNDFAINHDHYIHGTQKRS